MDKFFVCPDYEAEKGELLQTGTINIAKVNRFYFTANIKEEIFKET